MTKLNWGMTIAPPWQTVWGWSRRLVRAIAIVVFASLALTLSSCSNGGQPPQAIITQAVMRQAEQQQAALWQQLALQTTETPALTVKHIQSRHQRQVKVASDLAYEVTGTYDYNLRYPNRRKIEQAQVPFTIILKGTPDTESWQLLDIPPDAQKGRWHWESLGSDRP